MPNKLSPFQGRDLRQGVYRKSAVSESLVPDNSVSFSQNFNFDTTIGKAVVRPGTTVLTSVVASNKNPLGLTNFVGSNGTPNLVIVVYSGATTATIYYYDTVWHSSSITNLDNTSKNRFASLGGRIFRVNGVDAMTSSNDGNIWGTSDCQTTGFPSLVRRSQGRLLVSGDSTYPDRVYFSSIIDPTANPFIIWNDPTQDSGFIDINPDDGDNITGFAETSGTLLIFKGKNIYRMDAISETVDVKNVFPIGAVSQEAIVNCQGMVYFFSGQAIWQTDGGYPTQISRVGVQDLLDAIPQANWTNVAAGTDGLNVYFSIGDITLFSDQDEEVDLSNVVLKFSPRDQNWSIHSYAQEFRFFTNYTNTSGNNLLGADTIGNVQTLNSGVTDNGTPIFYAIETQELEMGDRSHLKQLSDKIVILMDKGIDSSLFIKADNGDFKPIEIDLSNRVNIGEKINSEGYFFTLRISGESSGTAPIFEGFILTDVSDLGVVKK